MCKRERDREGEKDSISLPVNVVGPVKLLRPYYLLGIVIKTNGLHTYISWYLVYKHGLPIFVPQIAFGRVHVNFLVGFFLSFSVKEFHSANPFDIDQSCIFRFGFQIFTNAKVGKKYKYGRNSVLGSNGRRKAGITCEAIVLHAGRLRLTGQMKRCKTGCMNSVFFQI